MNRNGNVRALWTAACSLAWGLGLACGSVGNDGLDASDGGPSSEAGLVDDSGPDMAEVPLDGGPGRDIDDAGPSDMGTNPMTTTVVFPSNGGGSLQTARGERLTITFGTPQPMGSLESQSVRATVGPWSE